MNLEFYQNKKDRIQHLENLIDDAYKALKRIENANIYESDPRRQIDYENDISTRKQKIEEYESELKVLKRNLTSEGLKLYKENFFELVQNQYSSGYNSQSLIDIKVFFELSDEEVSFVRNPFIRQRQQEIYQQRKASQICIGVISCIVAIPILTFTFSQFTHKDSIGWIWLGGISNSSGVAPVGNSLSVDTPIYPPKVPSPGDIITVKKEVTLRSNSDDSIDNIKGEIQAKKKLVIIGTKAAPHPRTSNLTWVWAEVRECDATCNE